MVTRRNEVRNLTVDRKDAGLELEGSNPSSPKHLRNTNKFEPNDALERNLCDDQDLSNPRRVTRVVRHLIGSEYIERRKSFGAECRA